MVRFSADHVSFTLESRPVGCIPSESVRDPKPSCAGLLPMAGMSPLRTFAGDGILGLERRSLGHDEAVAAVTVIEVEQFGITLRPCAAVQIALQSPQRLGDIAHRPEGRHGGPNSGIEIGRGPPPVGAQETVRTIMGNRNG